MDGERVVLQIDADVRHDRVVCGVNDLGKPCGSTHSRQHAGLLLPQLQIVHFLLSIHELNTKAVHILLRTLTHPLPVRRTEINLLR